MFGVVDFVLSQFAIRFGLDEVRLYRILFGRGSLSQLLGKLLGAFLLGLQNSFGLLLAFLTFFGLCGERRRMQPCLPDGIFKSNVDVVVREPQCFLRERALVVRGGQLRQLLSSGERTLVDYWFLRRSGLFSASCREGRQRLSRLPESINCKSGQ